MKNVLIGLSALMVAAGANAATITYSLASPGGVLGSSQAYTVGGLTLTATGYDNGGNLTALYGKNGGGDEVGLGLNNDPTGDHEIAYLHGFVQIDVSQLVGKVNTHTFKFATGSTTDGEEWGVFGSNTAGSYSGSALLTGSSETTQILTDLLGHRYYDFVEINHTDGTGDNFLIHSFSATSVPEPATWAMLLAGVFGVGAVARARRRAGLVAG